MITDKIPSNITVEDLKDRLTGAYDDVKQKSKKSIMLKYNDTKVVISKQKKGFDVSPNIPGYAFCLCFLFCTSLSLFISRIDFDSINWDNGPGLVGELAGKGLVFGLLLYWIFAEIYVASKKKTIEEFCDSLKL